MTTVRAYCAACDTELEVRIPAEGVDALHPGDLACPHGDLCGGSGCVLRDEGVPLREALEFLPAGGAAPSPRNLAAATRLVERGRRASLAREIRRWRLWWGGR